MIGESIDLGDDLRWRGSEFPGSHRLRQFQRPRRATAESDMHSDPLFSNQRHVSDQQPNHAFPLPVGGLWILPQPRKITSESGDSRTLLLTNCRSVLLPLLLVVLLCFRQRTELVVPVRLERVRDQAIRGIDVKITALCQVGFISRPFDLFLAEMVHFLDSRLKLLLHRERDFQRQRSNAFYQQSAHRIVDVVSDDSLTYRHRVFDAVLLADVLRHEILMTDVVSNRHPAAASATNHQALQQCWTLARRTLAAVGSIRVGVFLEPPEVLFII